VVRAFAIALAAFGVALAGLLLPTAFIAASSVSPRTTVAAATCALAGAAYVALRRLAAELAAARRPGGAEAASAVFAVWAVATCAIAGRLWWELVAEVAS